MTQSSAAAGRSDWEPTSIPGAARRRITAIEDSRGSFAELWRATWTPDVAGSFRQANLSRSQASVLRGMHFHERQTDLWVVVEGLASVALVDLRPLIAGRGSRATVERFEMPVGAVTVIPPGVAHGFVAREPLALLYLVSREYDGTDEHGFAWDDDAAAIDWPIRNPILSGRDASAPSLQEAVERARQRGDLAAAR